MHLNNRESEICIYWYNTNGQFWPSLYLYAIDQHLVQEAIERHPDVIFFFATRGEMSGVDE